MPVKIILFFSVLFYGFCFFITGHGALLCELYIVISFSLLLFVSLSVRHYFSYKVFLHLAPTYRIHYTQSAFGYKVYSGLKLSFYVIQLQPNLPMCNILVRTLISLLLVQSGLPFTYRVPLAKWCTVTINKINKVIRFISDLVEKFLSNRIFSPEIRAVHSYHKE